MDQAPRSLKNRSKGPRFRESAAKLAEVARGFYQRGWVFGTSGNLSAVIANKPLSLVITPSGLDKGALRPVQFLKVDRDGRVVRGKGQPSNETGIHLAIVRVRAAGAVLHTHSVWSTIVSDACAPDGGVHFEGFEMLKGLRGVQTHEHKEWLPILDNLQDIPQLSENVRAILQQYPAIHGFLLRRHGLYAWGRDVAEAKRHVEILEFLLEIQGRNLTSGAISASKLRTK